MVEQIIELVLGEDTRATKLLQGSNGSFRTKNQQA